MQARFLTVVLAILPTAQAQVDAVARPPAKEAKEQRVALTYETAKTPSDLPVQPVGFYLSLGKRFKLKQVDKGDACEASLTYAGQAFRFRVEDPHGTRPELRLDLTGATEWGQVERLPADRFLHRQKSYMQAILPPLNERLSARVLRLICVTQEGREPYAFLGDRGVWSGTLSIGNDKLKLSVYDKDADGDIGNDKLMLDVDGDGKVTRVEQIANGETILLREHAITLRITQQARPLVTATVARRSGEGRDILEELKRAPVAGNVIPEFKFMDQRGKMVSSLALRGKVLLVNFWGVW